MAKYFYTKHIAEYIATFGMTVPSTYTGKNHRWYKNYSLDPKNGYVTFTNLVFLGDLEPGTIVYNPSSSSQFEYAKILAQGVANNSDYTQHELGRVQVATGPGTLLVSGIIAEDGTFPTNGIHTDGSWYVRGELYLDDWTPGTISITGDLQRGNGIVVNWGRPPTTITVNQYEVSYQLYRDNVAQGWSFMINSITGSHAFTLPTDARVNGIEFRVRALISSGGWSNYRVSEKYNLNNNKVPTINLTTIDGRTFYENETFLISGTAKDLDIGNVVNVKYQINSEPVRAIETKISTGADISFNRTLTLKNSRLLDGTTPVTEVLADSSQHVLKVWAEDDQGGKSPEQIRTFYVVANRAPVINVDNIADQSGMVNADTIRITGRANDPDGNDITAKYRINTGALVDLPLNNGEWIVTLPIKQLVDGNNNITIEVTDSYNFKSTKTIRLRKDFRATELPESVQRYKIEPPRGSAKGILLWVQREESQTVEASISMSDVGSQESYTPMNLSVTAPVGNGVVEDEFIYEADTARASIHLKLNITGSGSVALISGVLL